MAPIRTTWFRFQLGIHFPSMVVGGCKVYVKWARAVNWPLPTLREH